MGQKFPVYARATRDLGPAPISEIDPGKSQFIMELVVPPAWVVQLSDIVDEPLGFFGVRRRAYDSNIEGQRVADFSGFPSHTNPQIKVTRIGAVVRNEG
jgi:hypothetical protein